MTVTIISVLVLLFVLGLLVPQKRYYFSKAQYQEWKSDYPAMSAVIEKLGLNEIYVAPVTIFFLGLFFANLIVVIGHRVPIVLRKAYLTDKDSALAGIENLKRDPGTIIIGVEESGPGGDVLIAERAASFFRKYFWSVIASKDARSFIAVRNRFSPFGFLLFHLSFLFCLIGGLLIMYTRFSGNLLLTEGQKFYSDISQFRVIHKEPKIFKNLPELGIELLKVSPRYEGRVGTDLDISMRVKYFSQTFDATAKVNEPVKKGSVSILPENIGVTPLFVLRKKGGRELTGGYFILNVLKGDEDSFEFPDYPYRVYVHFYPDFENDGVPATRTYAVRNPVFRLRIEKNGKVLYDGFRKPGEWAVFDSLQVACRDIRYWADFLVVREYGRIPLFAGFILGIAGLIIRLVFFQKTVRVHIEKRGSSYAVLVGGRSEYYQLTFRDELEKLATGLAGYLREKGCIISEASSHGMG